MIGLFEVAFLGVMVVYGGIGVVFCVYLRMLLGDSLWEEVRGLTEEEVKKLEEEMVEGQVARVLPGCRHAFHRPCVDAWLQVRSACPLCRALLLPLILSQTQHQRQLPYSSS
ncbi:E3 ubiquitin-protein ligase ATL23-like [Cocos nucifera]|uniref:E3 ubiquitin-protein ligase ATL23-like n=1 Tax=Cocos nucifera TaxID=13894 RepID=A0A8K0IGF1_COCNU|nr:E3 ubiquitin-protein ligase ATL23-like [Cocos nucifera]